MKYYKVTTYDKKSAFIAEIAGNNGFSIEVRSRVGKTLVVDYPRINIWIKPKLKKSCLMVWDDIEKAIKFANQRNNGLYKKQHSRIFECKIKKAKQQRRYLSTGVASIISYGGTYWTHYSKWIKSMKTRIDISFSRPPKGTVFADEIMLIKEIKVNLKMSTTFGL